MGIDCGVESTTRFNSWSSPILDLTPNKTNPWRRNVIINGAIIKRNNPCIFLGVTSDDQLKWGDHIASAHLKLTKSLYIINRCKHYVPHLNMHALYNSIINLSYVIVLWRSTYKTYLSRLWIVPKKVCWCLSNVNYNADTSPLFKENNVLPLDDCHGTCQLEIGKYMHNALRNKLPHPLNEFQCANSSVHDFGTRRTEEPSSNIAQKKMLWLDNKLCKIPSKIKNQNSMSSFKRNYNKYFLLCYTYIVLTRWFRILGIVTCIILLLPLFPQQTHNVFVPYRFFSVNS